MTTTPTNLPEDKTILGMPEIEPQPGKLDNKIVEVATNQTSKAWYIVAIVVGALVVLGVGGFGTVGLLQSHGLIHLPPSLQWLISAIGVVGNTPHSWSLWAMAVGGIVGGIGLIAFGSYKIHKARMEDQKAQNLKIFDQRKEERMAEVSQLPKITGKQELQDALSSRPSMSRFGDNFGALRQNPDRFDTIKPGHYSPQHFGHYEGEGKDRKFVHEAREDRNFIVIRTHDGQLLCTQRLTQSEQEKLTGLLKAMNYQYNKN